MGQWLSMTAERVNRALAALQGRHGIREALEQRGKAQIKIGCLVLCAGLTEVPLLRQGSLMRKCYWPAVQSEDVGGARSVRCVDSASCQRKV